MVGLFEQAQARLRRSIDDHKEEESNPGNGQVIAEVVEDMKEATETAADSIVKTPPAIPQTLHRHSSRKAIGAVDKFTDVIPLLSEAGFRLESCDVEASLTPKVIPRVAITRQLSKEDQKAFLEDNHGNRFAYLLFEALFKAVNLTECLDIPGLTFVGLEVHIGAIPQVRALYQSKINWR